MGMGRQMKTKSKSNAEAGEKGSIEFFKEVGYFNVLPEGCIANIISLTSPINACRLSAVSKLFKSAADSDSVWERFLPIGHQFLPSGSDSSNRLSCSSKKQHFLNLCLNPVAIDDGKKSFFLDKRSGKKCYMLSARDLSIVWADTSAYWTWTSLPESRFKEVVKLNMVCWLEIRGKIDVKMLSPSTLYSAYLVFKATLHAYAFKSQAVETTVGTVGGEARTRSVYLHPDKKPKNRYRRRPRQTRGMFNGNRFWWQPTVPRETPDSYCEVPNKRDDGWLEIELGEFFYDGRQVGELEISVLEVKGDNWKSGLILEGIEIRPKGTRKRNMY